MKLIKPLQQLFISAGQVLNRSAGQKGTSVSEITNKGRLIEIVAEKKYADEVCFIFSRSAEDIQMIRDYIKATRRPIEESFLQMPGVITMAVSRTPRIASIQDPLQLALLETTPPPWIIGALLLNIPGLVIGEFYLQHMEKTSGVTRQFAPYFDVILRSHDITPDTKNKVILAAKRGGFELQKRRALERPTFEETLKRCICYHIQEERYWIDKEGDCIAYLDDTGLHIGNGHYPIGHHETERLSHLRFRDIEGSRLDLGYLQANPEFFFDPKTRKAPILN